MTVTALIVDDEPLSRLKLRELVAGAEGLTCVGEVADGDSAVREIDRLRPDVVFLDIQMPGRSGLRVLESCRHHPVVIFTTAFDRYAVTAFELEAVDYLLKPFGRERFEAAVRRARARLERPDPDLLERARLALGGGPQRLARIFVRHCGHILPLTTSDIERLEAEADYVAIVCGGRRYLVHLPLSELEQRLDPERFVRIHRGHIVNLDHVAAFRPQADSRLLVEMHDGTRLMASRTRSRELRDRAV